MEFFIVVHHGHGSCESYHRTFPTPEAASEFAEAAARRRQEEVWGRVVKSPMANDHGWYLENTADGKTERFDVNHVVTDDDPNRKCPHCGGQVVPSEVAPYRWTCPDCEEDFFDFECKTTEQSTTTNNEVTNV